MKTQVKAELLLASKNAANGSILYTWRLTFPRPILGEVNTHRVASRNTSSSRAIPSKKMRAAVLNDPFIPISIGKNQKGMQAGEELSGWRLKTALAVINLGRYPTVFQTWLLDRLGVHKQVLNRYLEPYSWCTQIFSATDVNNLLTLRNHPDAEPHFRELARQMQRQVKWVRQTFAYMEAHEEHRYTFGFCAVQILQPGQWHIPFIISGSDWQLSLEDQLKVSAARCARTSYTLLDTGKVSDVQADIKLCERLFGGDPKHLSPTEHQAQAVEANEYVGNFRGFKQYRKTIIGERGE